MKMMYLDIAGIKILCGYNFEVMFSDESIFSPFLSSFERGREDIYLEINRVATVRDLVVEKPDFSTPAWKLKKKKNRWLFDIYNKSTIVGNLEISPDFTEGVVTVSDYILDLTTILPVYIFSLVIMSYLLERQQGVFFHGAAVKCPNMTLLFSGKSGVGKSTLSSIFRKKGYLKYGDDKLILTSSENGVFCSSTPFDWKEDIWYNKSEKPSFLLFLKHSSSGKNSIHVLDRKKAMQTILYSNYIPFYLDNGLSRTFQLLNVLLENVHIFEYEFIPDESSVDYLLNFCNAFLNANPASDQSSALRPMWEVPSYEKT